MEHFLFKPILALLLVLQARRNSFDARSHDTRGSRASEVASLGLSISPRVATCCSFVGRSSFIRMQARRQYGLSTQSRICKFQVLSWRVHFPRAGGGDRIFK